MGKRIAYFFFILSGLFASIACIASDPVSAVFLTKAITLFWICVAISLCVTLTHIIYGKEVI